LVRRHFKCDDVASGSTPVTAPTKKCPDRRNPGITLAEWGGIRGLPSVETATAWLSGQADFDYKDRHVKNVGYDAQSTDWIKTDMADISPGRSFSQSEHDDAGAQVVSSTTR
jgi:putative ABC transport system permease protein